MRSTVLLAALLLSSTVQAQEDAQLAHGKAVYEHWCAPCHAPGARKHPGTAALQVLYQDAKPAALEEREDLTPELVSFYVRNGVSIMPFFRKTEISDKDLADLSTYLSKP